MSNLRPTALMGWWETATQGGQSKFHSLEELAQTTGLSRERLESLLQEEVTTLGEWWTKIGVHIYKSKQRLADELTLLLPKSKRPLPRTTLRDYLSGKQFPRYKEYLAALYAVTALPCFRLEGNELPPTTEVTEVPDFSETAASERAAIALAFGKVFRDRLRELIGLPRPQTSEAELEALLMEIQTLRSALAEADENTRLSSHLSNLFLGDTATAGKEGSK